MAKDYDYSSGSSKGSTRDSDVFVPSKDTPTRPPAFPKNPKNIVDTYRPDSEKHIANILKDALNQPEGVQTITKRTR